MVPAGTPLHTGLAAHRPNEYQPLELEQVTIKLASSAPQAHMAKRFVYLLAGDLPQVDPKRVVRKVSRHLVSLFFVLALVCYLDRANLAFAASQLREDLHFSASTYGVGAGQIQALALPCGFDTMHNPLTLYIVHSAGIFFPGYALFQIPSNLILVKVGAPLWLSCMLALW